MPKTKILLIMTTSENVINFRIGLIKALLKSGFSVHVVANDNDREKEIVGLGIVFHCAHNSNRSINPLKAIAYKRRLKKVIKKIGPDVVFTFQAKPNTFGVLVSHACGVKKIFSMVEGLGDVFIRNSATWKIIRGITCRLYKKSFRFSKKVFFLNEDDKNEFVKRRLVKENQCVIIHGIGVNLGHFSCKPIKNDKSFLMIARMLKTKGIYEYCECARRVRQKYPDAQFNYLGAEGDVKLADIESYIKDGSINYLGTTKDVRPYIEDSLLVLLPSYREGLPMSIMEAESMGRGVITSNNVGCRDTVIDGLNGFLIEGNDVDAMACKCMYALEHRDEMVLMGQNARLFAEKNFDSALINQKIIGAVYE